MQTNKKFELRCGFPQAMIEARCPKVPRGKAGKPPRAKGATAEAPGQLPLAGPPQNMRRTVTQSVKRYHWNSFPCVGSFSSPSVSDCNPMVRFARHGVFVFVPARPPAPQHFSARAGKTAGLMKNIFGKREFQMKKWMAGALALAMVLAMALTGCGGSASSGAVSGSAAASGADDNVLTVAMECAYAPYNWTQNDDSNGAVPISGSSDYANGYDVMMAKKMAEALGMELEIVRSDWDSLVPAVISGTVDCVIAGQSITSERMESVDFTTPYYYASVVTLVKADGPYADAAGVADLAGATCTSQLNTIWYDNCLPQIENANILPAQETAPAMLVALDTGACDVVVTDMPTAMAACVAYPSFKLLDFTGTEDDYEVSEEDVNIGISVRKGNTQLLDALNEALAGLTQDDFTAMMDEAISIQPLSN